MNRFRSMGCEVVLPFGAPLDAVRELFAERDSRFSRFLPDSELNRVNANFLGVTLVSEELASMISLSPPRASRSAAGARAACGSTI